MKLPPGYAEFSPTFGTQPNLYDAYTIRSWIFIFGRDNLFFVPQFKIPRITISIPILLADHAIYMATLAGG